jgi:catechol 2,3-dioxygenase-like lactoylglutathione lyase family enzyme
MNHAESISAITLVTADMAASVAFYAVLGSEVVFGGAEASFTTLKVNEEQFLNLQFDPTWVRPERVWGRFILWVDSVDLVYDAFSAAGFTPLMAPSDAVWGERYFHILDPAGHEVSIARRLDA